MMTTDMPGKGGADRGAGDGKGRRRKRTAGAGTKAKVAIVSLRIPVETAARVAALVEKLPQFQAYQPWNINAHSVMRLAMDRGLRELEAETAARTKRGER